MSKTGGKFVLGGLIGMAAGILLAPKAGKETREKIKKLAMNISVGMRAQVDETKDRVGDIFGKVNNEAVLKYRQVRDAVVSKIASIKTTGKELDKDKYGLIVDEVVAGFKKDFESTKDGLNKITKYLKKDWEKMKKALS